MVSNVVVLGGGHYQRLFLERVHARFGPFILVDRDPNAPGRRWAARFYNVSVHDFERCRDAIQEVVTEGTAIVTFATGPAGDVCNRLCQHFGLPGRSSALTSAAVDKKYLLQQLAANGLSVPLTVDLAEQRDLESPLARMVYPAVVKPSNRGGGTDVRCVLSSDEARRYCALAPSLNGMVLQEKLYGREQVLFVIVKDGRIAGLMHGLNVFDTSTGWAGPIGIALERVPTDGPLPPGLEQLAADLIRAFDLENDFVVAETIATERGHYVIDVEVNAFGAFVCSKVMEDDDFTDLLIDVYLGVDREGPPTRAWVSSQVFFTARERARFAGLPPVPRTYPAYDYEPPGPLTELTALGARAYKGGHVVVRNALDLEDATRRALGVVGAIWEESVCRA